jgi:hypothetical protein
MNVMERKIIVAKNRIENENISMMDQNPAQEPKGTCPNPNRHML